MAAARATLVALGLVVLMLVPIGAQAASITGTLNDSGALNMVLAGTDPNGSTLRSAMDGNFAPLVNALPINASTKATILGAISLQESGIAGAFLFGNRDGTVEANEVTMFETLIQDAGTLFSSTGLGSTNFSLTSLVALTLDGAASTSTTLGGIAFSNAVGPATSSAPIGIDVTLNFQFPSAGTSHTLSMGTNVTGLGLGISLIAPSIEVNLSFPSGTTVTGTSGFGALSTTSDPWGWSSPSMSGTFSPGSSSTVSVSYGPAFPTGEAVAIGVPAAAVAIAIGLLLVRRRRRRTAPPAPLAPQ